MAQHLHHYLLKCSSRFSQHAWLSLLTILLLMGSALGLWWAHPSSATGAEKTRSAVGASLCSHASLALHPQTTVEQLKRMLKAEDALIQYGPDEFGEFQLRFGATEPSAAAQRLRERAEVVDVIEHRQCQ